MKSLSQELYRTLSRQAKSSDPEIRECAIKQLAAATLTDTRAEFATIAEDKTLCQDLTETQIAGHHDLCHMAYEAGHASLRSLLNDWQAWNHTVGVIAEMLTESIALRRSEAAGLGPWEDIDSFLRIADPERG